MSLLAVGSISNRSWCILRKMRKLTSLHKCTVSENKHSSCPFCVARGNMTDRGHELFYVVWLHGTCQRLKLGLINKSRKSDSLGIFNSLLVSWPGQKVVHPKFCLVSTQITCLHPSKLQVKFLLGRKCSVCATIVQNHKMLDDSLRWKFVWSKYHPKLGNENGEPRFSGWHWIKILGPLYLTGVDDRRWGKGLPYKRDRGVCQTS